MEEEAIRGLIGERALRTLLQPIVDGVNRTLLGHEALTRGLLSGLESPTTLIECASRRGLSRELESLAKSRGGSSCVLASSGRVEDFTGRREPTSAAACQSPPSSRSLACSTG